MCLSRLATVHCTRHYLFSILTLLALFANGQQVNKDTTILTQNQAEINKAETSEGNRLKVFVDCSNTYCDNTFIRSEIDIVDFLLDRIASDVHILITSQRNGSGGDQFQMIFYGQNRFINITDTLKYNLDPNATDFESRDLLVKYLKIGLTPFILKTDYAGELNIQMKRPEKAGRKKSSTVTKDNWNYWVYRVGSSGNINLDQVYKSNNYRANISANRTTDKLKINFTIRGNSSKSKYEYERSGGITKFVVKNSSYGFNHGMVVSINQHWSYGYEANFSNSTFSNNKSRIYISPAIEYAIFPYKMVNNKFLTIRYGIDYTRNAYYDTTVYLKKKEVLTGQNLSVNLSLNQKWGNINSGLNYRNYFSDWSLNNLGINLDVNVRITGGLTVFVSSFGGLTRDQVFLPKGGATEQEILTRRRQIASGYEFYSRFGFNFRFGSKLNNFVNPRFDSQN